jgi:two-component system phosphate regulon sensor histidine kinase PhoR
MVIENIIDNASKYSYEHKSIEIIIVKTKKFIKIVIKDEGVGIDKRDQERLFRKFSSIDNPLSAVAGGTGLGLYWANKIMELHGGNIEVSSDPSKGSVFTLKIPINKDS